MKIGDTVPVTIAGQTVAQATIKETADGTATLVVPATLVVMATRTELAYEAPNAEPERETIITGVDRANSEESATVSETPNIDNSTQDASTTDDSTTDVSAANVSATNNSTSDSTDTTASNADTSVLDNVAPTTPPVENVETPTAPVGGNDETS